MRRRDFLASSLGLASLTLLSPERLIAWHDEQIASDFDRALHGDSDAEAWLRLVDHDGRIIAAEVISLQGWEPGEQLVFSIDAREPFSPAGITYRLDNLPGLRFVGSADPIEALAGRQAQWWSEWRHIPFHTRTNLIPGDSFEARFGLAGVMVEYEHDPPMPTVAFMRKLNRAVLFGEPLDG